MQTDKTINRENDQTIANSVLRETSFLLGGVVYRVTLYTSGLADLHQRDHRVARVHTILWRTPNKGYSAKFTALAGRLGCNLPKLPTDLWQAFCNNHTKLVEGLPEYLLKRLYVRCRGEMVYLGESTEVVLVWSPDHCN